VARDVRAPGLLFATPAILLGLLDGLSEGILLVDAQRRCLYASAPAAAIVGVPRGEISGCDLLDLFGEGEREPVLEHFGMTLAAQPGLGAAILLRPSGDAREIEYFMRLLAGPAPIVAVILRDVSDTRRLSRNVDAVARIASSVAVAGSLETTMDALARSVVKATGTVACGVLLTDDKQQSVRVYGTYGLPLPQGATADWEAVRQAGAQVGAEAIKQRRPMVYTGARQQLLTDPVYAPVHELLRAARWDTVVAVPLIYRGRAVGALNVFYPFGHDPGETEITFLTTIADQAAVAAESARLFDEGRKKAILEERQRLARELHDSVSQALYGIALGAQTARTLLDRSPTEAAEPLDYVLSLAEAGLTEMRALIFELRPETLETEGLGGALRRQADAVRARHGIDVSLSLCDEPDLPYEVKEAVYRIAQEALNNVVKHARAGRVDMRFNCSADTLTLEVVDDGVGFASEDAVPGHLGLQSMRERAISIGGTLEIDSAPVRGTRVVARIPRTQGAESLTS